METLGVVGAAGTGTTTTAVDLAAALRREGHHAAVLDLTGDVADWFDVSTPATLAAVLAGEDGVRDATETVALPHGDVEAALADYAAALGRDETSFRAGGNTAEPGAVEPGDLPVLVGGDRSGHGDADEAAVAALRGDLGFAYDYVVADAGTFGAASARLLDGVVVVTDPSEGAITAGRSGIEACRAEGLSVVGAVLNQAPERADVADVRDELGVDVLAAVPADAREPAIEPIAFTAPESPAAQAYGRLADAVAGRDDGSTGSTRPGEAPSTDARDEDGSGDAEASTGATDDDGVLGRLADRFR